MTVGTVGTAHARARKGTVDPQPTQPTNRLKPSHTRTFDRGLYPFVGTVGFPTPLVGEARHAHAFRFLGLAVVALCPWGAAAAIESGEIRPLSRLSTLRGRAEFVAPSVLATAGRGNSLLPLPAVPLRGQSRPERPEHGEMTR